jgi:translation initiation factor IF-2
MPSFFDRLGKVAQQTAAAAQQTANEGRIKLEIHQIQTRFDDKAKSLGQLMYRRHSGEEVTDEEMLAILQEMQPIEAERKAKEDELEEMHKPAAPEPAPAPAPAAAQPPAPAPAAEPPPVAETPVAESPAAEVAPAAPVCACGATNAPGAKFCTNCGQPLRPA